MTSGRPFRQIGIRMADFEVTGRSIARAMGHDGESVGRYRETMSGSPR